MYLLAKYGTQTAFVLPVVKRGVVDLAVSADWTPATGDTKISKDGGNVANTTNNPAAVGGTGSALWTLTITATELQCAEAVVQIVDSATKAIEDQVIRVYTYGHASAKFPVDFSDLVRMGLTALPNANAEAAGGLYTRGSGAGQIAQDANGRINANVAAFSAGAITNAAFDTTAGAFRKLGIVDSGTLQSATSGTAVLRAAASFGTDDLANAFVTISGGTGVGQSRVITAWNNTTKTATVSPAWTTTPDGTSTYDVFASPAAPSSSASTIAAAVWDLATSGHTTSGTFGAAMSAAGAAGDPWATALPGAYGSGTAGNIIGNRLDAAITSRMASYTQPTGFLAATFPGTVASTTNITGGTITTVTNLTNAPTAGDLTATMKASVTTAATAATPAAASVTGAVGSVTGLTASDVAAIKAKTDNLPASPAAVGSAMTLTSGERNAIADAAFLRQLAESYRSNGAAPTLAQALCEILAHLTEASISGTNKTTKRFDHSTTATVSTLTLDGDGNATDITRSS